MNILKYFSCYLSTFFMSWILSKCYEKLNCNAEKKKNKLLYIIVLSIGLLINNLFSPMYLRTIISFSLTFLFYSIIYKNNFKDTFYYNLIITIFGTMIELILSFIMFLNIKNLNILNNELIIKIPFSIIEMMILYSFFSIKAVLYFIQKIKHIIIKFDNYLYILILILFIINPILYFNGADFNNLKYIYTISLFLAFLIFSIINITNNKYTNLVLEEKNKNLKDSFKAYSETIEECRELKHNLKHDLYYLRVTLPKEYQNSINNLIKKYNKDYEWINRIDEIPEGLQGLIYLKINEAKSKKIKIIVNNNIRMINFKQDYIDISNALGILIDNAIEATEKTSNKIIEINFEQTDKEFIVKIINCFNNTIDLNKIGNKNYSTKKRKSGIGLNYIKKLKNINIKFEIKNDIFISTIKYNKK